MTPPDEIDLSPLLAAIDAAVLEPFDYPALVREGNRLGLLRGEWPEWRRYRHMRARSSHTYAQKTALQVVAAIPDFLEEARHLLHQLEVRS